MLLSDHTFYLLLLHLATTGALWWYTRREKALSTARYTWGWRALFAAALLCLSFAMGAYPRELNRTLRDHYYAEMDVTMLCIDDASADYAMRALHVLWACALVFATATMRDRARKLTLAQSCRYVAIKYGYVLGPLVALCRRHAYPFFPLRDFERYVAHCEAPEQNGGVARVITGDDITRYIAEVDQQEHTQRENEARYTSELEQSRVSYERGKVDAVLARKHNCDMTYERYMAMKSALQQCGDAAAGQDVGDAVVK